MKPSRITACSGAALVTVLILSSCADNPGAHTQKTSLGVDSRGWNITQRWTDEARGATAVDTEIPEALRTQKEREYAQSSLVSVPSMSEFNTQVFQLRGLKEYESTVVVAPKIFAYGTQDSGRLIPRVNRDGTVTLTFNVAFTDGLSDKIRGADDSRRIEMGEGYLVKNLDGLKSSVTKALGREMQVRAMPGCVKELAIVASGTHYPVDISDLAKAHHCALNQPISVSLTVSEAEAWRILQEDLHANQAEVRGVWEVALPVSLARLHVELNRKKLFEAIEAELGVNVPSIVELDFKAKVRKAVRAQMLNITIEGGEKDFVIDKLVQMAIQEFASQLGSDDPAAMPECKGGSIVCLKLNYENSQKSDTLMMDYEHRATSMRGERFVTWAKLKPLMDREAEFQIDNADHAWTELGLTAAEGDILEIQPLKTRVESKAFASPQSSRLSNPVCVKPSVKIENRCHVEWRPIVESAFCLFYAPLCVPVPKQVCQNEVVGPSCDEYQDRYQDVTAYGRPVPEMVEVDQSSAQLPQLFTGLFLKFNDGQKEEECPLSAFERTAYGNRIAVRLANSAQCQIFPEGRSAPIVSIGNKIKFTWRERGGRDVVDYTGARVEQAAEIEYVPKVDVGGKVVIRGYGFTSQPASTGL